jgi:hypothetical protein
MADVTYSSGELLGIGLGFAAALGIVGVAAYRAGRRSSFSEVPLISSDADEWDDELAVSQVRPLRAHGEVDYDADDFMDGADDLLHRLELRALRSKEASATRGHMLAIDERKGLERIEQGGRGDQQIRAQRLLTLHDVANGYEPAESAAAAVRMMLPRWASRIALEWEPADLSQE